MFKILVKEMFSYKAVRSILLYVAVIVALLSIAVFTSGFLNAFINVVIFGIVIAGIAFVVERFMKTTAK